MTEYRLYTLNQSSYIHPIFSSEDTQEYTLAVEILDDLVTL